MPQQKNYWINVALLCLLTLGACVAETVLWFECFGATPSPQLWALIALYIILYRKMVESILLNYCICLFIFPFSVLPLGSFMLVLLLLTLVFSYFKTALFWPGTKYFVISSFMMMILLEVLLVGTSYFVDIRSSPFSLMDRFFEIILTPIFAPPIYWILTWLDKVTDYDSLPETGGGVGGTHTSPHIDLEGGPLP